MEDPDLDPVPYCIELLTAAAKINYAVTESAAAAPANPSRTRASRPPRRRGAALRTTGLSRYETLLRAMPDDAFTELNGAWLSDYGFSRKIDLDPELHDLGAPKSSLATLARVCFDKGVSPKGFVPEKKRRRGTTVRYLFDVSPDPRFYVGENKPKYGAEATPWSFSKNA